MSKNLILLSVVAIVFAGVGFWGGTSYSSSTSSRGQGGAGSFAARSGVFGNRAFGAGNGGIVGTIVSSSKNSFTVQLPAATTTNATTGTKIVLYDSSTQIEEMQNVPATNLTSGKNVVVTGTTNSDGSITASNVQIRAASYGPRASGSAPQGVN